MTDSGVDVRLDVPIGAHIHLDDQAASRVEFQEPRGDLLKGFDKTGLLCDRHEEPGQWPSYRQSML